jgi:hypothetical protein
MTDSDVTLKMCSSCEKELPLTAFHRDKTHKDGYKSKCKKCRSGKQPEIRQPTVQSIELAGKTPKELETIARSRAIKRVLENHWGEFQGLMGRYRREVGLPSTWTSLD